MNMIKIHNYPFQQKFLYRVQKQDTLQSIAHRFNVDMQKIKKDNNVSEIYEGLVLFINTSNTKTYVVKPLDTLESISKKLNIKKEELIQKNNIKQIFIGQKLEY